MYARLVIIAAALSTLGAAAAADPARVPDSAKAEATHPQKPVVLASADSVETPAPAAAQQPAAAPKKRAARVTTCRCGDPQPSASDH
jgi:hypothetical protein